MNFLDIAIKSIQAETRTSATSGRLLAALIANARTADPFATDEAIAAGIRRALASPEMCVLAMNTVAPMTNTHHQLLGVMYDLGYDTPGIPATAFASNFRRAADIISAAIAAARDESKVSPSHNALRDMPDMAPAT